MGSFLPVRDMLIHAVVQCTILVGAYQLVVLCLQSSHLTPPTVQYIVRLHVSLRGENNPV